MKVVKSGVDHNATPNYEEVDLANIVATAGVLNVPTVAVPVKGQEIFRPGIRVPFTHGPPNNLFSSRSSGVHVPRIKVLSPPLDELVPGITCHLSFSRPLSFRHVALDS